MIKRDMERQRETRRGKQRQREIQRGKKEARRAKETQGGVKIDKER